MAHDAHHLPPSTTCTRLTDGFAVVAGDVVADLPLPVGGPTLRSTVPGRWYRTETDSTALHWLTGRAHHPFDTLQFLALPVIPALKLSDQGLVDVTRGQRVELCE